MFVTRCSKESDNPLAELIEQYIFSRETELDTFKLLVCHENNAWDEQVLQNLEDEEIGLEPLKVYIFRIAHLASLSGAAFGALGATEVVEDVNLMAKPI